MIGLYAASVVHWAFGEADIHANMQIMWLLLGPGASLFADSDLLVQ